MSSVEEKPKPHPRAAALIHAIVRDLDDRRGLGHEWRAIDADIRAGIWAEWFKLASAALEAEHAHCLAELRQSNTPVVLSAEMLDRLLKQERLKVLTERRDLYREGSDCWRAFNGALRDELLTTPEPSDAAG